MTVLQLFNKQLGEIPTIAKEMEKRIIGIKYSEWSEEEKKQATTILRQLQTRHLAKIFDDTGEIVLVDLNIVLSPAKCGIECAEVFDYQNVDEAMEYVEKLLTKMNKLSEVVKFKFEQVREANEKRSKAKFTISWNF